MLATPRYLSILLATLFALLASGCATRLENRSSTDADSAPGVALVVQHPGLSPKNGGRAVSAADLHDGDIILTAANGLTSAGIRLLTLAPVSHAALYIGDRQVAEAVGSGVRVRSIDEVLNEESVVVAFRHPKVTATEAARMRTFAMEQVGRQYSHLGVLLQAPFSIERRVCELPLVPEVIRDMCIRGIASIQLGVASNDRFFCSQFVLEAYREAGIPVTDADPRWLSPSDILHMREHDVPAVKVKVPLVYVGHLKYSPVSGELAATGLAHQDAD
jgi:cell wall-associated NlpC family hydrolase